MSGLDLIAAIAIGAFLITASVKGKTKDVIALAKEDTVFLKWAIAVAILWYLASLPELKGPVSLLIVAAFIGFAFNNFDNIKNGAIDVWSNFGANTK